MSGARHNRRPVTDPGPFPPSPAASSGAAAPPAFRHAVVAAWIGALRRRADTATLHALPQPTEAEAAHVMALMRGDAPTDAPPPLPAGVAAGRFQPSITLMTLGRGDGLLGMERHGAIGPRGGSVTLAQIDWLYRVDSGPGPGADADETGPPVWQTPAPTTVLNARPAPVQELPSLPSSGPSPLRLQRDLAAEADAIDLLRDLGLQPIDARKLQWRDPEAADCPGPLWTLPQESAFGDFWADAVPRLRAQGWRVVVRPGFAHESVAVQRWRLVVSPDTGEPEGKEVDGPLAARSRPVQKLRLSEREGAWLLSLGVEIDGETLDLAPMLADLLRRDARWLDARRIAAIDDIAIITLRAPGGRRIEAPAEPLKAIVGALVDLLADPARQQRREGEPLRLGAWETQRLQALQAALGQGAQAWQLQGDAGLSLLAQRLRTIGTPQPVAAPRGLQVPLRGYQAQGLAWLQYLRAQGLGGILADEMGLGKTAQALAHVLLEKESGRLAQPALVVLPTSLLFNWQAEAARMAPGLRVLVLQGPDRARHFARMAEHDLVLTTYPRLWRDAPALSAQAVHLVILDEAQMVKNAGSRSARALRSLQATHRLCLTGTPLENHLGELWAQFDFLMPGFLGDARQFAQRWRKPIEENGETLRAQLLARRVRPFILRRRKADVAAELPPRTDILQRVKLQGRQRTLYEAVRTAADKQVRRALARQGWAGAQIAVLDALLKLRQVCCDPRLVKGAQLAPGTESAKLEWLAANLPALVEQGRRVLVFSQFTALLDLVGECLDGLGQPFLRLTGRTPPAQRAEVVERFQQQIPSAGGGAPVLLVSLKAGGTGLNLTAADTVIHLDPWWNPAAQEQATARAHRIGQDQPVFVYRLVAEGSIEERLLELQARKQALADGVLGHDAAETVKFDEADLRALLAPLAPA